VRIAITANGPGEFAGWVRPLLAALRARDSALDAHVLCVPDDFATGREAQYIEQLFPGVRAYAPSQFVRLAFGRGVEGLPPEFDRVQYLGGDLSHAARAHARLGGVATSYKFSRKKYARTFARVFAVDAANKAQLEAWATPPDRIRVIGNLAIDGALGEASGAFGDPPSDAARDGIMLFPGSRKHEIANLLPMFVRVALNLRRMLPDVPIAFAGSPFVADAELRDALARGGEHPLAYGAPAGFENGDIVAEGQRFPLVRAAMRAAASARLAVSIPGTKVIELASLGIPAVVCTPFNAPELVVVGGPFQYVGKLPLIGKPLKRAAVIAYAKRFAHFAQPNIDAGKDLDIEIAGTLLPSQVARAAAERYRDRGWCAKTGAELRALYRHHAGAAERMAGFLLEPVRS
jgi:lipid-A-disaccharide synthase